MLKFTTASGSVYFVKEEEQMFARQSDQVLFNNNTGEDDTHKHLEFKPYVECGLNKWDGLVFEFIEDGKIRVIESTPVVEAQLI